MRRLFAALFVAVAVAAYASPASGATWTAAGDAALSGTLARGSGAWTELPWTILWQQSVNEPRSAERLASGNTLVACGMAGVVRELGPTGTVVWEYREPGNSLFSPWHATELPGGTILIVSRREREVLEVTRAGELVWRYGGPDVIREGAPTATPRPGELVDPFFAVRLPDGDTLICDNQGGRVLQVRTGDWNPTATDDGYTTASLTWQYTPPDGGWPKYAQRLPGGNTLIAGPSNRVFEIDPAGAIVWELPAAYAAQPVAAVRLADGSTLVADEAGAALRVDASGAIIWRFATDSLLGISDGGLDATRRVLEGTNGSILIDDEGHDRLLELGRALDGAGESGLLDCGLPGVRKLFTSVDVQTDVPEGTTLTVAYSVDGGPWQTLSGSTLPAGTYGTLIRYRIEMTSLRHDTTPRLLGVSIGYEPAPESTGSNGTGSGSGSGSDTRSGRTNRTGTTRGTGTGTMAVGEGYTSGGVSASSSVVTGALSVQRGWAMDAVAISVGPDVGGGNGTGGSPAPDLGGLLALGTVYSAGIVSAAIQRLLAVLIHRTTTV